MKQPLTQAEKEALFDEVIDRLWDKSQDGEALDNLNEFERPLIISQLIQDSINGGGINAYFFNHANRYTTEGLDAFQRLGLEKVHQIFRKAVDAFSEGPIPDDIAACRAIMEARPEDNPVDEAWYALTDEFYELDGYILDGNISYIQANQHKFT